MGFQNLSKIPCPTHQKTQREKCFISMKFQHHDLCGLKDDESIITGDPLHISVQTGSSIWFFWLISHIPFFNSTKKFQQLKKANSWLSTAIISDLGNYLLTCLVVNLSSLLNGLDIVYVLGQGNFVISTAFLVLELQIFRKWLSID